MEVIVTIVSKLVYFTYLRDLQPTYVGVVVFFAKYDFPLMI